MTISTEADERASFLNVDLDISSKTSLKQLTTALGKEVFVLHSGWQGSVWSAHLELSAQPKNADVAIRRFAALVRALPQDKQRLWDAAKTRDFNIGVQAGPRPHALEIKLMPRTIRALSSLKAGVVFTVYATTASSTITR